MSKMDVDENVGVKHEDNFSNSAEGSSDDEDANDEKISQLQKQVEASPYTYELHVELINLCRKAGDLEKLRDARERMSGLFPLTPELWLDWVTDEKTLATTPEQKEKLTLLFERALKDYPSVSIWLEYVQFSIGTIGDSWDESGLSIVRQTFERAATSVGIHVTQGCLIWEAYREFETIYLLHLKNKGSAEDEIKKQEDRIFNIFKRQLSIPLVDMDKTYAEFLELHEDSSVPTSVDYSYNKAVQKLEKLQRFEEALYSTEDQKQYEEYKEYIKFEKAEGDPSRVQSIYERALIENCLKEELWADYTKYVDYVIKIKDISLPVHERAVRNCPWCASLWSSYGRALERYEAPHDKIKSVFETALEMGFTKAEDFKELWLAFIDYLRRQIDKQKSESQEEVNFKEICDVFERAIIQMESYFWGSEPEYVIMKCWIFFNVKYKKDIEAARKIWKDILDRGHKDEARVWLEIVNFERLHGDDTHYRKVLLQALSSVSDWQETFVDLLITFEREEGTLDSLEKALAKCEIQMRIINEKRLKKMEEETHRSYDKDDKKQGRQSFKRQPRGSRNETAKKAESKVHVQMDSEGFKIPPPPAKMQTSPESKQTTREHGSEPEKKKRSSDEDTQQGDAKKRKVETTQSHGMSIKHDPSNDYRTVFLSNLSYQIDDEEIRQLFSQVGEIEEVRLVKDYKGRSKGYCYVVYKSQESVKAALAKDREQLDGRPVLVSPCEDRKHNPSMQPKFKFGTGLEKNKLFVKGLPFSTTKEDLENMFKEFGALKEIRLVTYRNGHSKGLAYVDFEDEGAAANAVLKLDGSQVMESVISVAISNPPPRKPKREFSSGGVRIADSLGGGGGGSSKGPRGRGRTQLSLVPRSVVRQPPPGSKKAPNPSNGSIQNGQNSEPKDSPTVNKPLSNSDFAKMLQK